MNYIKTFDEVSEAVASIGSEIKSGFHIINLTAGDTVKRAGKEYRVTSVGSGTFTAKHGEKNEETFTNLKGFQPVKVRSLNETELNEEAKGGTLWLVVNDTADYQTYALDYTKEGAVKLVKDALAAGTEDEEELKDATNIVFAKIKVGEVITGVMAQLKESEQLDEKYIGKPGIERVKKMLYKAVDQYIKIVDPMSEDADDLFFVKDMAKWYSDKD